jgi:FKBP-type peptidyl-prolyl cis-trans isomerase
MKLIKILAIASAAVLMIACNGSSKEGSKAVLSLLPAKSHADSAAYLLGVNFGMAMVQNKFQDLDMAKIREGINDALKSKGNPNDEDFIKQFRIDPNTMNEVLNGYVQKMYAYEGALNLEKGNKFRKDFMAKNSADSTMTGIVYLIQDSGSGVRATSDRDTVRVNYRGTLIDGTEFDKNDDISFPLNGVISGWTEGMKLVGEGGKITLVIPANMAYGERGPAAIGVNSTLIFDVDLLEVRPYVAPAPVE